MGLALLLAGSGLLVRCAATDVTPNADLPMGGYTERGDHLGHGDGSRLFVRVSVLERDNQRIAIAVLDALTIPESLAAAVRERIPPGVELVLVATHTHCAPDSQMANVRMTLSVPGIANYDRKYADTLAREVDRAVRNALAAPLQHAATIELVTANAPWGRARREGAEPDPRAFALKAGGKVFLATFGAHPTLNGPEQMAYRGDWPGSLAALLDAPVATGAIGDISPNFDGTDADARSKGMAKRLAQGLEKGRSRIVWAQGRPLALVTTTHTFANPVPHPTFAQEYGVPAPLATLAVQRFAPTSGRVSLLALGECAVVFVPAEPTVAVARRIEREVRRSGFGRCVLVSHADGWAGYVLEPEDYDRGGYEATLSFYGRSGADGLVDAVRETLARYRSMVARSLCGQSR
ncbi:MAG: hypothetical protein IT207_02520 [Fimbriimonadaceae bacterium]|nr:hypothetical protein [Fimbriimonadaceae bacterium]